MEQETVDKIRRYREKYIAEMRAKGWNVSEIHDEIVLTPSSDLDLTSPACSLDEQGIIHAMRTKNDLDEAPGAYKDITEVMENQKDLVDVIAEPKPLAVIKG